METAMLNWNANAEDAEGKAEPEVKRETNAAEPETTVEPESGNTYERKISFRRGNESVKRG